PSVWLISKTYAARKPYSSVLATLASAGESAVRKQLRAFASTTDEEPVCGISPAGSTLSLVLNQVPVPVSGWVCGLPASVSETFKVAFRTPVACGVNVSVIVQVPPAATDVQVLP